tara:strand:- start:154 stop:372 length:219 start_codon:yes stop_codon:yes gene_type:complete
MNYREKVNKELGIEVDNKRAELVNNIIFLTQRMDEMWLYHPENPNKLDVVEEYKSMKDQIDEYQNQLDDLEK